MLQRTDVIFEGYAVNIIDVRQRPEYQREFKRLYGHSGYEDFAPKRLVQFLVSKPFKEAEPKMIQVWEFPWGRSYERGKRYMVFAYDQGGFLTNSKCDEGYAFSATEFENYFNGK